ncbi:MAG: peptidyl-prolyl cis-trans isomerase [Clostridia bacterium]|nr:peptidyl-prolyl cis-trans isomerase [Clostridia bacterium]MBQ7348311.1 peptidyl-prolyl cis-trans isomerase [Clostridia bacterium]
MKKICQVVALTVATVLLLALCAGCSSQKRQEQKVIGTCAGCDVLYEELRYVTLTYKDLFEATYGEGIWDNPATAEQYRAELEETVWSIMLNNYAVLAACQAYGMQLEDMENEDIVAAVDRQISEAVDAWGDEDAFAEELKSMYMTEHLMRFVLTVTQMENELLYVLTDDLGVIENDTNAFINWLEDGNCVYVRHVFVRNDKGDDIEANRAAADELRRKLTGATDEEITAIVKSAANEELNYLNPYYIVRDVYTQEMETAAFALAEVGEVSEVIETEDGFYVLLRVEDNPTTLLSNSVSLLSSYQWAKVEQLVETYRAELTIEKNDYGKSLDLLAIE